MTDTVDHEFARFLGQQRVIVPSLTFGVIAFTTVTLFIKISSAPAIELIPIFALTLIVAVVVALAAYLVFRRSYEARVRASNSEPAHAALQSFRALTVIRAPLIEGLALLGTVYYWLSRELLFLTVPIVAAFMLLLSIPSRAGFERYRDRFVRDA